MYALAAALLAGNPSQDATQRGNRKRRVAGTSPPSTAIVPSPAKPMKPSLHAVTLAEQTLENYGLLASSSR